MADASSRTDTSTVLDTDDKNQMVDGQSGAIVPSNSSDRSDRSDKPMDQKVLRRLAQNREAARKSRLRKKAYVQQLESSKLKLASLEQEINKARQQGIYISSSGDQTHAMSGNGAMTFDLEYARWLEEQNKQINELRTAVNAHASDSDLRLIVDGIMAHYDEIFRLKGVAAKADVFHILSGMWKTPAERCFLWLGGFRSSELLKLLVNQLEPLTEQQLLGLSNLQQSSQQAEDALSQGMEALQQSLADTLAGSLGPSGSSGNVANYMGQMAMAMGKLGTLENFLRQADNLRQQTLHQMQRILTIRQAARALLAIHDYFSRLRALSSLWLARPREWEGWVGSNVGIFGYSRKTLTDEDLRSMIEANLTCRVDHHENCDEKLNEFLKRTYYIDAGYDNKDGMVKLNSRMSQIEGNCAANRIFYLAVPQEALLDVALSLADSAQTMQGWNRIIIEKPFGFTGLSSHRVTQSLLSRFEEEQIYRIDHLLGKDLIENLTVLRFSNLVFEPLWSRTYIRNVQVIFSEETAAEIQGRYFGNYGIIRDIVHSHILQTIALFAMEPPVSLDGEDIRDEKVKVLRSIRQVNLEDVVLGQLKDTSVKVDRYTKSLTPTYFAAAMYIDNSRWDGVPFLIKTGIGLMENRAEIRIQFRHVPGNIYRERFGHDIDLDTNELILRDQPEEAILLKVNNKVPGLGLQLDASELNLLYRDRYNVELPDSYEHLLLDVLDGDSHLFMRSDEVAAAWNVLTPLIHEIDQNRIAPELYEAGGRGPVNAYYLAAKHGVRLDDEWSAILLKVFPQIAPPGAAEAEKCMRRLSTSFGTCGFPRGGAEKQSKGAVSLLGTTGSFTCAANASRTSRDVKAVPESMIVPPVPFFRANSDSGTGSLVDPTVMPFSER
uniref:Glucose-6-phosphate 1-dehydrogenase n=1 Tax=Oryza meridionalis TaxID=40149 RepID=A0A0E0CZR7_9ORYZ